MDDQSVKALKDKAVAKKLNEVFPPVFTMENNREIPSPELFLPGNKSRELAQIEVSVTNFRGDW